MVRLHMDEAKLCTLFSLVPRASVSSRDQRALCRCWSYCILILGYLFSSLQMVSGQQILEACMKNFVIILRLVVQIHALRENGFEDLKAWIHICLPSVIFIFISERETLLFWQRVCSPNFVSFKQNSNKAKIKLQEQCIGAFGRVHKVHFWSVTYASFACCANFIIWSTKQALPYLQHEFGDFTQQIWKVSCWGLSKKICIQSLWKY